MKALYVFAVFFWFFVPQGKAFAQGQFDLIFDVAVDPAEEAVRVELMNGGTMELAVQALNDMFRLPENVTVRFGEGEGPWYASEEREIRLPYGFVLDVFERHLQASEIAAREEGLEEIPEGELIGITRDVLEHTLYHEAGHALVDMLKLPILGREEDAVDDFATFMLIGLYDNGGEIALNAAYDFFELDMEISEVHDLDLQGEHSLDLQRGFLIACLVYGSAPQDFDFLVEQMDMDRQQPDRCIEDHDRKRAAWTRLLTPHLKGDSLWRNAS